eukprot:2552917-Amphidinium_carterae.1
MAKQGRHGVLYSLCMCSFPPLISLILVKALLKHQLHRGLPNACLSAGCVKVAGIQHPVGETNIFGFDTMKKLRQNTFDFSRSDQV